jgi:hypothetical protein
VLTGAVTAACSPSPPTVNDAIFAASITNLDDDDDDGSDIHWPSNGVVDVDDVDFVIIVDACVNILF